MYSLNSCFRCTPDTATASCIRTTPWRALSGSVAALLTVVVLGIPSAKAETWTYNGSANDWSTGWTDGVTGDPAPPGLDGQTYTNIRLDIKGTATYGAAQGSQIYDISGTPSSGPDENRALTIGDSGSTGNLTLTGGTLTLVQQSNNTVSYMANGGGNGSLTLEGGSLVINKPVGDNSGDATFAVTWGGGTGTLTIGNGSTLSADRISFGQSSPDNATGTGTLNLNAGGVLEVRSIRENSGALGSVATLNFDGGTIRVRGNETNGFALIEGKTSGTTQDAFDGVFILGGGLTIDTNNFTARITEALLDGDGGNGGLTKTGSGTLVLQVDGSTYKGNTVVNAGTLAMQADNTTYAGAIVVKSGATFQIGNNSSTGSVGPAALTIESGGTLAVSRSNAILQSEIAGIKTGYSGDGKLEHKGSGLLTLDVANTYTGTTTVANNSHLRISNANALGSNAAGTIVISTGIDGETDVNGGSLELEGGITITGETLTIRGTGGNHAGVGAQQRGALQSVSGSNTWAGTVNIAGTNTRIGVQDGASLTISGTITDNGAGHRVIFRGGTTTAGSITLSGSGNSWSETLVFGSSLRIAGNNILPTSAALLVGTGGVGVSTFDLNGFNQQVTGLSQTGTDTNGLITNRGVAASILTLSGSGDRTYLGRLADGTNKLSLVKSGSYVQILGGANTYTGDTTVNEGALLVAGSITGSTVNVSGGALGGTGTIAPGAGKSINVLEGGVLRPGLTGAGTLSVNLTGGAAFDISTGVAAAASQSLAFDLGAIENSDLIAVTGGSLNIGTGVLAFDDFVFTTLSGFGEGTYTLFTGDAPITGSLDLANLTGAIGTFTGTLGMDGNNIVLTVIPEPSVAVAILSGTAILAGFRRRNRFGPGSR